MVNIPCWGIDTIRYILPLHKLNKLMKRLNLEYEKSVSRTMMKRFKREVAKVTGTETDEFELDVIKISKASTNIGYILVKRNDRSIKYAKSHKKAKNNYREVIFTSLFQPTKKTHSEHIKASYNVISEFVKYGFNPIIDLSLDGFHKMPIHKQYIDSLMSDYLENPKLDTNVYKNSYYINSIKSPINQNFKFERLNIYDKYIKNGVYPNWKRLELTVQVKKQLSISKLEEVIESATLLASNYFNFSYANFEHIEQQYKYMKLKKYSMDVNETIYRISL